MRTPTIALTCVLMIPAVAHAQLCRGAASFRGGSVALGAGIDMAGDATSYSARLSAGQPNGVFATGALGTITIDGVDVNSTVVSGTLGYQVPLTPTGRGAVCPLGGLSYEWAEEAGIRATATTFGGGVSIGGETALSPTASIVPFVGVGFFRTRVVLDDGIDELSATESYGQIVFGAGLVLNGKFTIQPSLAVPFGLEDADHSFGISVQINLGAAK